MAEQVIAHVCRRYRRFQTPIKRQSTRAAANKQAITGPNPALPIALILSMALSFSTAGMLVNFDALAISQLSERQIADWRLEINSNASAVIANTSKM